MEPDIIKTIDPLIHVFNEQKIEYLIGGSVASSLFGFFRATHHIDIVARIKMKHVKPLVAALEANYYISESSITDALNTKSSFNLIHLETLIKVDIFVLKDTPYHQLSFQRRIKDYLDEDKKDTEYFLATPEDIVLNKLAWYKLGGSVSDRQWNDLLGVLKVQKLNLDKGYLLKWARELEFSDLLKQAFEDSGFEEQEN